MRPMMRRKSRDPLPKRRGRPPKVRPLPPRQMGGNRPIFFPAAVWRQAVDNLYSDVLVAAHENVDWENITEAVLLGRDQAVWSQFLETWMEDALNSLSVQAYLAPKIRKAFTRGTLLAFDKIKRFYPLLSKLSSGQVLTQAQLQANSLPPYQVAAQALWDVVKENIGTHAHPGKDAYNVSQHISEAPQYIESMLDNRTTDEIVSYAFQGYDLMGDSFNKLLKQFPFLKDVGIRDQVASALKRDVILTHTRGKHSPTRF